MPETCVNKLLIRDTYRANQEMHIAQYYRYSNSGIGVGVQEIIKPKMHTPPSRAMVLPIPSSPKHSHSTHSFQAKGDISPSRVDEQAT
jgi:hypothetical protein